MTRNQTAAESIEIVVNGAPRPVDPAWTLERYLRDHDLDPDVVVVERNGAIVPRGAYAATRLEASDRLEIVHFVGGG